MNLKKLTTGVLVLFMLITMVACGKTESFDNYLDKSYIAMQAENYQVDTYAEMTYGTKDKDGLIDSSSDFELTSVSKINKRDRDTKSEIEIVRTGSNSIYDDEDDITTTNIESHFNLIWNEDDEEYESNSYIYYNDELGYHDDEEMLEDGDIVTYNPDFVKVLIDYKDDATIAEVDQPKKVNKKEVKSYTYEVDSKKFFNEFIDLLDESHTLPFQFASLVDEIATVKKGKITLTLSFYKDDQTLAKIDFTDVVKTYNKALDTQFEKSDLNGYLYETVMDDLDLSLTFSKYGKVKKIKKEDVSKLSSRYNEDKDDMDNLEDEDDDLESSYNPQLIDGDLDKIVKGDWSSFEFSIDDVDFEFPFTLKDVKATKFVLPEDLDESPVSPGSPSLIYFKNGDTFIMARTDNFTDKTLKQDDDELSVSLLLFGIESGTTFDIAGITETTTEDELLDLYPKYSAKSKDDDDGNIIYRYKSKKGRFMEFLFNDGKILAVTVIYDRSSLDYE